MEFDISSIKKENGAVLDINYEGPLKSQDKLDFVEIDEDIDLKGTLSNYDNIIWLNATLRFSYAGKCSRCLEPVKRSKELKLTEKYSTKQVDDETYVYESNYVDLTKAVIDNIIVALPVKLVCSDDCKGLCEKCGINLNNGECKCEEDDDIDERMKVLKKLL